MHLLETISSSDPGGENLPTWYQHFLGRRFREGSGKFFTPQPVASAMTSLLPRGKGAVVMDPTCGGGTFLLEASRRWGNLDSTLVANDVESSLVDLAQMVLGLGALPAHARHFLRANIYEPDEAFREWYGKVDCILANPPFSLKIETLHSESRLFSLGYTSSDALFLDVSLKLLRPGGRLVCLLPHSVVANAEFERMRFAVEECWELLGVIGMPEGVFHITSNTTTRADIVLLEKREDRNRVGRSKAVFAFAPSVGVPLNNRAREPYPNHLDEIAADTEVLKTLGVIEDSGS